ncbi:MULTISPECIES: FG-GAP-like repeat-containing protein [Streptomyces]|uniref:Trypsin-like serine protease n=2 Tax=Streptomyces TaxID=1883 RepID=A0A3Q9FY94_STRLT|nr:FG-GAP-like repeat-containing protein [Streptomyces luteoverticillatus]AZQ71329.1 trypsin-like serine protease [Streptomyces luteoverticillatus]
MSVKRSRTAWTRGLVATGAAAAAVLTSAPAQAVEGATAKDSFQFTAKLDIGGERSCTAALVDEQWLITATSCFADNPAQDAKVPAGAPKLKTTATIGRTDLTRDTGTVVDVVQLVPRDDRDVVLAKLAKPVAGVTPAAIAGSAPIQGEELRVAGYGRTKTEWVPDALHYASFTVGSVKGASLGLTGKSADAVICQGDTGGPAFRDVGGRQELVGVNSRSWQGGCFGTDPAETRKDAVDARVDDLGDWIITTTSRLPLDQTVVAAGDYNGDGVADLYTVNASRELSVWVAQKGGRFAAPHLLTGGWDFAETASADLNGDGIMDLVARDAKNNLFRWSGSKGGGFSRAITITNNDYVYTQLNAGDFNADGKGDLIAMDKDKVLWLWTGKGDGTFNSRKQLTGGWEFTQTVNADFNGDGVSDLIARGANKDLLLWTGSKNGTFSRPTTLSSGNWNFVQTTAGDFTGDGKADLIAKDEKTGAPYIWLWAGNGNGTFPRPVKLTEGS